MNTNEPGREPTEPTDAAMFPREAQINTGWTLDYGFICRVSDRTRGLEYPVGMEETESVLLAAEVELSGQRPMPPVNSDRNILKNIASWANQGVTITAMPGGAFVDDAGNLSGICVTGFPNRPAPDEVAQLHGGMCPQIVAGNFIVQCNGIVRDKAGVLLFQLEDYAPLTARVAELDKRLSVIRNWSLVEEGNESDWNVDWNRGYSAARRWVAMWFKNDAAPGKELPDA